MVFELSRMNQQGFNLVELLVAIAIFGIISTAVVANLRGGSSGNELNLQADNISSLLRQAQIQSSTGQPFNGNPPIGGYGVSLATCSTPPCSVTLFADENGNFAYDGAAEEIQVVTLGSAVTINAISEGSPFAILFKPPRPYMCFGTECSGIGEATITLGSVQSDKTLTITANQISGSVSTS